MKIDKSFIKGIEARNREIETLLDKPKGKRHESTLEALQTELERNLNILLWA